jgi:hypothetical protein
MEEANQFLNVYMAGDFLLLISLQYILRCEKEKYLDSNGKIAILKTQE